MPNPEFGPGSSRGDETETSGAAGVESGAAGAKTDATGAEAGATGAETAGENFDAGKVGRKTNQAVQYAANMDRMRRIAEEMRRRGMTVDDRMFGGAGASGASGADSRAEVAADAGSRVEMRTATHERPTEAEKAATRKSFLNSKAARVALGVIMTGAIMASVFIGGINQSKAAPSTPEEPKIENTGDYAQNKAEKQEVRNLIGNEILDREFDGTYRQFDVAGFPNSGVTPDRSQFLNRDAMLKHAKAENLSDDQKAELAIRDLAFMTDYGAANFLNMFSVKYQGDKDVNETMHRIQQLSHEEKQKEVTDKLERLFKECGFRADTSEAGEHNIGYVRDDGNGGFTYMVRTEYNDGGQENYVVDVPLAVLDEIFGAGSAMGVKGAGADGELATMRFKGPCINLDELITITHHDGSETETTVDLGDTPTETTDEAGDTPVVPPPSDETDTPPVTPPPSDEPGTPPDEPGTPPDEPGTPPSEPETPPPSDEPGTPAQKDYENLERIDDDIKEKEQEQLHTDDFRPGHTTPKEQESKSVTSKPVDSDYAKTIEDVLYPSEMQPQGSVSKDAETITPVKTTEESSTGTTAGGGTTTINTSTSGPASRVTEANATSSDRTRGANFENSSSYAPVQPDAGAALEANERAANTAIPRAPASAMPGAQTGARADSFNLSNGAQVNIPGAADANLGTGSGYSIDDLLSASFGQ